jgi:hypothetical protein
MKSKQFLFFAALGCMTAPVAAQTVNVSINCGQTYTINSTATASAGATYRWMENGNKVTGTAAAYTVPATKSVGIYTYIRQAKSEGCADWQNSNAFTVEVKNKEGIDGVCLGGIIWAKYNVDEPGTFAATPESPGKLYQYNSPVAYPAEGPATWSVPTPDDRNGWSPANSPCAPGWRIPTAAEFDVVCVETYRLYMPHVTTFTSRAAIENAGATLYVPADSIRSQAGLPKWFNYRSFWLSTAYQSSPTYSLFEPTRCSRQYAPDQGYKYVRCVHD